MKKSWQRVLGFGLGLAYLLVMAACSSSPVSRSTGTYMSDTAVEASVKAKLAADRETKAHQVQVEVFRGTVQLSGFVDSQTSAQKAEEIAGNVEGVDRVVNNLIVKEPQTPQ
ncbi:MAG: BON domain-containing protein [Desulfuromonadales bacterium]|jgi:osmotically-inducible protein OsmY